MNLFSIWRSSSLEILYSKRIIGVLYGLVGLLILVQMSLAYTQFFNAYITLGEFDVPVGQFVITSILFFLPLWIVGAVIVRACTQRLRIALWIRQAIKVVSYSTQLSPAEAGFLADFGYSKRELTATLLDLHFRGVIQLVVGEDNSVSIVQLYQDVPISRYESVLLEKISELGSDTFQGFDDTRLVEAAQYAHEVLIDDLTAGGVIHKEHLPNQKVIVIFRALCVVAAWVAWVLVSALINKPDSVLTVMHPRYPVDPLQIVILIIIALIIIAILVSSFWSRLSKNYKSDGFATWIDAAGLLMYIRGVFKHRFSEESITTQDKGTLRDYAAYAIAYGVIPDSPSMIAKIINTASV